MTPIKLTTLLDAFTMGGAEHMIYEHIKNIDTQHFDLNVLCYMQKQNTLLAERVEKQVPVTYLNQGGHITLKTIWRVVRAIQDSKPDIVHAHMGGAAFGAIWSILFGKPLVITIHAKPGEGFNKRIETLVRIALTSKRTKLVAVSAENEQLVKSYYHINSAQCVCVNNGIDIKRFGRKEHEFFTLINVARQDDNKNQAMLLRCFAKFHKSAAETKLLLLGDGPNHENLKDLAKELGICDAVTFTGNVANTEDYYAVSDLYVQTSFREAMPLSVLEAMAAGLPVVSTNVGGLADVVQDNGILVLAGDEEALYQAITKCYQSSPEEKKIMGKASLRIVQDYSAESMAKQYEKIYSALCAKKVKDNA